MSCDIFLNVAGTKCGIDQKIALLYSVKHAFENEDKCS